DLRAAARRPARQRRHLRQHADAARRHRHRPQELPLGAMLPELRALVESYLAGFWARRWSIVAVAWLTCLAGWAFVVSLPDRYESTSRVYVDTETILGPLLQGLAVTPDIDAQVEIIRRTLLSRPNL